VLLCAVWELRSFVFADFSSCFSSVPTDSAVCCYTSWDALQLLRAPNKWERIFFFVFMYCSYCYAYVFLFQSELFMSFDSLTAFTEMYFTLCH